MSNRFRIKIESDLVDLSYLRTELKVSETKTQETIIVGFQLKQILSPENCKDVVDIIKEFIKSFVKPEKHELVVLSGRGPIWLYAMLTHQLEHVVPALGIYDPKVGVVVVSVHNYYVNVDEGTVLEIDPELKSQLTQ